MEAARSQVLQQLSSGDFNSLVHSCEELELAIQEEPCDAPSPEQDNSLGGLYALHLLAYLLEGHLCAARFLWKRTPAALQQHPQVAAAHSVLTARWQRQYADFFKQLRAGPWEAQLQPLANEVLVRSRERMLDEIGEAYEVIAVERLAAMLGAEPAEARAACCRRSWPVDAAGHASPTKAKVGEDLMQMGEAQLKKLARYVAYLEQPQ
uniref:CSN8/PSMD8/EIF3K domain-containing protein n=1 Tax=Alexandrium monilatum TaxID=311494 RepID=A0A7S4VCP3_9DINO